MSGEEIGIVARSLEKKKIIVSKHRTAKTGIPCSLLFFLFSLNLPACRVDRPSIAHILTGESMYVGVAPLDPSVGDIRFDSGRARRIRSGREGYTKELDINIPRGKELEIRCRFSSILIIVGPMVFTQKWMKNWQMKSINWDLSEQGAKELSVVFSEEMITFFPPSFLEERKECN